MAMLHRYDNNIDSSTKMNSLEQTRQSRILPDTTLGAAIGRAFGFVGAGDFDLDLDREKRL